MTEYRLTSNTQNADKKSQFFQERAAHVGQKFIYSQREWLDSHFATDYLLIDSPTLRENREGRKAKRDATKFPLSSKVSSREIRT